MTVRQRFRVEEALTPDEMEEALQIRFDVFVKEQGVSPAVEADEFDEVCLHFLVRDDEDEPVGTARLNNKGNGIAKIERVAVIDTHRGRGIGRILIQHLEDQARMMGFRLVVMHSQTHCKGFYEKLGYLLADTEEFDEDGIPHVRMEKLIYQPER